MSRPIVEVGEVWSALFIYESTYSTCRHHMIWSVSITVTGRSGSAKSRLKKNSMLHSQCESQTKTCFFFPNPSACHTMDKVKIFCTSNLLHGKRRYGDQRYTRNSPTVDQSEPSSNVASKMLWSYWSEAISGFTPSYTHLQPWFFTGFAGVTTTL